MSQQTKKINTVLNDESSALGQLIVRAQALSSLDKKLQRKLPDTLQGRYKVAGFEKGLLTLLTDNSATATEMRYLTPELLTQLRRDSEWAGLINIKIKVHQHWHEVVSCAPKATPEPPSVSLSEATKSNLRALIETLSDDPKNKTIIKSLNKLVE